MHFLLPSTVTTRSRKKWMTKSWSSSTAFVLPPTTRLVVLRVAMIYLSTTTTTTVPVTSWVMHQRVLTSHAIRNNHRRYHTASLDPYLTVRTSRAFPTIQSRVHLSHDREKSDDIHQTTSSKVPSLTSEMLSLRFRDVFAHFQSLRQPSTSEPSKEATMNTIPDESIVRMNLLRTRHMNLELDKCRIDVSTIPNAGYGVYATKAISRNELITLYPGDALIQWKHKDHLDPNTDGGIQIFFGTHIPESERTVSVNNNNNNSQNSSKDSHHTAPSSRQFMDHIPTARSYEVRINDTISVIGDPHRHSDPAYLGHMINDHCTIDDNNNNIIDVENNIDDNEAELVRQYNIKSIQQSNCKIQIGIDHQCHVEIVATRNISLGEELFLSYGSSYWLSRRRTTKVKESTTYSSKNSGFGNNVVVSGKGKTKKK